MDAQEEIGRKFIAVPMAIFTKDSSRRLRELFYGQCRGYVSSRCYFQLDKLT
jgi:hypothetical protein